MEDKIIMSNIKENEQFIRVYNVFFDSREDRDEFLLTPEELLTYAAIDREDHLGNREQNILPYEYLLDVTNKKNTKSNRDKLIASIKSLESKSIITIIKEEKTYISVKVNHEEMKSEQMIEESKNNFEKVFIEELKELFIKTECKPNEVYSYLLIKSEDRLDRTASIAYSLFGSKMGVTKTTAINVIKSLENKKVITSTEAKRKNSKEYEIKVYKCNIRVNAVKNETIKKQAAKPVIKKVQSTVNKVGVPPNKNQIDMDSLSEEKEEKRTVNIYEDFLKKSAKNKSKSMAEQIADRNREEKERSERMRESEIDELYDAYKNNNVDKFNTTARKMTAEEMANAF